MKRKIRLSEREFQTLVRRLVIETKNQWDEEIIESEDDEKEDGNKMSKEEAIEKIANFFKKEVFPKVKKEEPELLTKIKKKIHAHEMKESYLREDDEKDDKKSLKDRRADRKDKAMIYGGLGTMGTGMIAALGEFMGYSDFKMTNFLHDLNHMAGLDRYTGPVTVAMVFAGLAIALKGIANRDERKG